MSPDVDQFFHDWGIPATLEHVLHSYDPTTGDVEETSTTTNVTIVDGNQNAVNHPRTSALAATQSAHFLIRSKEFPETMDLGQLRLLRDQHGYAIQRVHESPIPGLLLLECTR